MLSKSEFEMLAYIAENKAVFPEALREHFGEPAKALLLRLEHLRAATMTTTPQGDEYIYTGEYSATSEGHVLLDEYRAARREKWIDRAFSFANGFFSGVATSVVSYFILQWLSR